MMTNQYQKIHPYAKTYKTFRVFNTLFTDPGDVVIDPCAGSGSTLVAAENLGAKILWV